MLKPRLFAAALRVRPLASAATLALVLSLGACATNQSEIPTAEMSVARASVTQAESAGAAQLAPVELLSAREKLLNAETAMKAEQYTQARRLAEQSAVDAELAERKSRAARARSAAAEMGRSNDTLEQEIRNRSTAK